MKNVFTSVLFLIIGVNMICAQQVTSAAGGNASGSGGSVSFTVGEVASGTIIGSGGTICVGVQQPLEVSIITGHHRQDIHAEAKVYPNPVLDALVVQVDTDGLLKYSLTDVNGIVISSATIVDEVATISMTSLPSAIYFVKIMDEVGVVKIFRVVKTSNQ